MATLKCMSGIKVPVCNHIRKYLEEQKDVRGHAIRAYLEGALEETEGIDKVSMQRTLAMDYQNIPPSRHDDWDAFMDEQRKDYLRFKDENYPGRVKYHHYIISPDPQDNIDLETMRDLAKAWAKKCLPDCQIAIAYHNDNKNHILHAHLIINNLVPQTGLRVAIRKVAFKRNFDELQKECLKRDLSTLRRFDDPKREDKAPKRTAQRTYILEERDPIKLRKYAIRDDVASRLSAAMSVARDFDDYVNILRKTGMSVRSNKRGDLVYGMERPAWDKEKKRRTIQKFEITGGKLGAKYAYKAVVARIEANARRRAEEPRADRETAHAAGRGQLARIVDLGKVDAYVTARQLADVLETLDRFDAYSEAEVKARLKDVGTRLARTKDQAGENPSESTKQRIKDLSFQYRKLCEARDTLSSEGYANLAAAKAGEREERRLRVENRDEISARGGSPSGANAKRSKGRTQDGQGGAPGRGKAHEPRRERGRS